MVLYLQANYCGTFALSEKNNYKDEVMNFDFYTLLDGIDRNTTFVELYELIRSNYPNVKKVVIDF